MSESSRSRVTITLGRTGQVVKRHGGMLENSFTDSHAVAGTKRSVRERLGNNVDSSSHVNNKRQRRDGRGADKVDDLGLSKDDLRYKIMQKNIQKQSQNSQHSGGDLRNFLSRPAQSSTNNIVTHNDIVTRDRMPEPRDTRVRYSEAAMDDKQHFTETRDVRHLPPVTRYPSQHIPEMRVEEKDPRKQHIMDPREGGRSILEEKDVRHLMQEQRAPNAVTRMESGVSTFSPWTLDRLRRRSPDESPATSRGVALAAPKRDEIPQRNFTVRGYDDVRTSTYMSKDPVEISRPVSSPHLVKMAPSLGPMKTAAPVAASSLPVPGSLAQRSAYVINDQVTVDSLLRSLGLEKFAVLFKAEEVDMYSLRRMNERDLKEMGLPMGPRKKILLTLHPRLRQQIG